MTPRRTMAKARMLHKKISVSAQVNRLSLSARLLFSWMITHADDVGRLKGDPDYIKAMVVPMTKWSFKKIRIWLEEIKNQGLIYYWEENNERFIEFVKWGEYQKVRKDRFIPSNLPSFNKDNDNQPTTISQPKDTQEEAEDNISELNEIEVNKSEDSINKTVADENSFKKTGFILNPSDFKPQNEGEVAALETWQKLEPFNKFAFRSTYLKAYRRGLPSEMFYQFASEIKQDPTITKPGAVFNKKVEDYFSNRVE